MKVSPLLASYLNNQIKHPNVNPALVTHWASIPELPLETCPICGTTMVIRDEEGLWCELCSDEGEDDNPKWVSK